MSDGASFGGTIGETYRDSEPWWPDEHEMASKPNVVFVVLDDLGFGSLGCFGSEIATPALDRLAHGGTRFTNFHATALCSPTRASLLTGRNHHRVGMAYLSHVDDGYPGYRGRISHGAATLAEMLGDAGWNTFAVGKWHLAPMDQSTAAGPYDQWPLGRGFDRFYGFLEGLTDQFHPELFADNHPIAPPRSPEDGYHLSEDLVDQSLHMVRDQTSVAPEKPFFLYLAFGATHTPFQVPAEYVQKYRGAYDEGWDVIRERRFRAQLKSGVIPKGTQLPPSNEGVEAWGSLSQEAQSAYARFQEVYAGFLEHTDAQIGRLLDGLDAMSRLEDTIVVVLSDNGASQEGGPNGVLNTTQYENGHFPTLDEVVASSDLIDGRSTQVNYPLGWAQAGNTPLKRYKQNTHAGGIRTPLIIRLPASHVTRAVASDDAFHHVTDIVPTVLELTGVSAPTVRRGIPQLTLDGQSLLGSLRGDEAPSVSRTQYFETLGHRAVWKDGWKAVAYHRRGEPYDSDRWELYHLAEDFSESTNLAETMPERLTALVDAWWDAARVNNVLPLDDRGFAERANSRFRPFSPRDRDRFEYLNGMSHIGTGAAAPTAGRSFRLSAHIDRLGSGAQGTLIAHGSWNSGYGLFVEVDRLVFDYNYYGTHHRLVSDCALPAGASSVGASFRMTGNSTGAQVTLEIDGAPAGSMDLDETFEYFIGFEGLDVGVDGLSPVRASGDGPFPFSGGLERVVLELTDTGKTYRGR